MQGLTEFAPVSSSGHLILVPWLFHWAILNNEELNKTFDVALHAGTFIGAVVYFWRDITEYLGAWWRSIRARRIQSRRERLAWALVIGTIRVILYVVDRRASQRREMKDVRLVDGVIIGIAQALALQPGVSRSGVTITAARGLSIKREDAARFSFLLSLPIIGGAALFKALKVVAGKEHLFGNGLLSPATFAAGVIASAISGFVVIWFLLAYLRRRDFAPFVVYRLAVAAFVLGIIASGLRPGTI